jgi:putative Mg2+ transporter-C (MgtC) family protein
VPPELHWAEALLRLVLAGILGGAIGTEREIREREAGLRTHMLVAIGAALFTIVSAYAWGDFTFSQRSGITYDPTRIAAQIVTGIGFLGAGAIIRHGLSVRGLTTAASLWATAAVGMAAGAGAWITALTITVIVVVSLWPLRLVADRVIGRDPHIVRMRLLVDDPKALSDVIAVITKAGGRMSHLTTTVRQGARQTAEVEVTARDLATGAAITAAVARTPGVEIAESSSQDD